MRIIVIITVFFTIYSCKSAKQLRDYDEQIIANRTLNHYSNIPVIRLIEQPENSMIEYYHKGIYDDLSKFHQIGFSLRNNNTKKWTKDIAINDKLLSQRLEIIENYSKVPKLNLVDYEKAQRFISLSNVLYSEDGKYAAITINFFGNFKAGDDSAEGYTLIFEKIDGNWKFITKITAYIS